MLSGNLRYPDTYGPFLRHPVWARVFDWLKNLPENPEPGIHGIDGEAIYANIHGYETVRREGCRYEAHRRYVDLQYCIGGGELIEWQETTCLTPADRYDANKDLQFFQDSQALSVVHMTPGCFATFLPHEAHMPKLCDGIHLEVSKLVVKVQANLVQAESR